MGQHHGKRICSGKSTKEEGFRFVPWLPRHQVSGIQAIAAQPHGMFSRKLPSYSLVSFGRLSFGGC